MEIRKYDRPTTQNQFIESISAKQSRQIEIHVCHENTMLAAKPPLSARLLPLSCPYWSSEDRNTRDFMKTASHQPVNKFPQRSGDCIFSSDLK